MRRLIFFILFVLLIILAVAAYIYFKKRAPVSELTLFGNVDIRQVDLGFRVEGRVVSMPFEEGDFVSEGDLIATLDEQPYLDQVKQAKSSLESSKISYENAKKIFKRREDLVSGGGVSEEDYQNSLATKNELEASVKESEANLGVAIANLEYTKVFSPSNGTILTRIREPGTVVKAADPVYTLSLISPIWVRAFVREPELGLIYPGMPARIYTDTPDAPVYTGHIGFISPVAEFTPKTVQTTDLRTDLVYRLRIIADNPDQGLRQGMPVTVKLPLQKPVKLK